MDYDPDPQLHTVPPDRSSLAEQPKWRRDFPIDTPQDNYQARRDFTKFMVLTSFAFVVGQFWIALQNRWRKARGIPPVRRIVSLDQFPPGQAFVFHYPTDVDPCLLIRDTDDALVAYASQCTHLQCPVVPEIDQRRLHCPCHAGFFDLATGRVLAGPPRRPLPHIQLRVKNGVVYATGVKEGTA